MSQADRDRLKELDMLMFQQGQSSERAGNTYAAHMQLYNVAVSAKDETAMEQHRLTLHSMLDVILDGGLSISQMQEERIAITLKLHYGK